jgi:hypothetical protein
VITVPGAGVTTDLANANCVSPDMNVGAVPVPYSNKDCHLILTALVASVLPTTVSNTGS